MSPFLVVITDSPSDNNDIEAKVLSTISANLKRAEWQTEETLIAQVRHADALLFMHAPLNQRVLGSLQRCKVAVRYGVGLDNVDLIAAERYGVPIFPIVDYCTEEVANHTLALILTWNRKIILGHNLVCAGEWNTRAVATGNWAIGPISRLSHLTLGIIGFGRIGRAVAERVQALGMKAIAHDPFIVKENASNQNVTLVKFDKLLEQADIVTIHLPLNEQTYHMFDQHCFELMKPGSVLVNTSRGGLVDEASLIYALTKGHLGGALLDVFETEPLPLNSHLRKLDNIVFSPHVSFYSTESLEQLRREAAEKVLTFLSVPS